MRTESKGQKKEKVFFLLMKDSHIFFSAKPQNLSNTFIYF